GKEMLNLDVEPSLVTLKYSSTSAVYQHKTSIEIFKQVLVRNGLPRFNLKSSTVTYKRQMCIQYNENDFDFVTRILSEDGLVFW
ncbi:MAG: contractile injection system protein, VgrG/Pvc8 family, partial [Rhodobacterales bacterium]